MPTETRTFDRAVLVVVVGMVAAIPIGTTIHHFWPRASGEAWLAATGAMLDVGLWAINPWTVGIVIYGSMALLVLGFAAALWDALSSRFA